VIGFDFSPEHARAVLDAVIGVFRRDPGVSPTVTLLTLAAVLLVVTIAVMVVILVLTPPKRRVVRRRRIDAAGERVEGSDESQVTVPTRAAWVSMVAGWPGLLVVALAVIAGTYVASGTTTYCTSCHSEAMPAALSAGQQPIVATATTLTVEPERAHHTECRTCHTSGLVGDLFDRGRMLVVTVTDGMAADLSGAVDSSRCLRCHSSVLDGVITTSAGTLRVSHAEQHDAGIPCSWCHQRIGHAGAVDPSMSQCIECHDAVTASAECSTCHTVNPTDGAVTAQGREGSTRIYPAVALDSGDCYGCHVPDSCDSCHGLRLPHPQSYIAGEHAYDAAWEGKDELCYRCHDPIECSRCHRSFDAAQSHPPSFREEHKRLSPTTACPCHDQRRPVGAPPRPFCEACH